MNPLKKYAPFLGMSSEDIIDFGLKQTKLIEADTLSQLFGLKKLYIKLETTHPTKTIKDRATEVLYNYFYKNNITSFIHTSTGNTATSLVWGLGEYMRYDPHFHLTILIPEKQLPYHNFDNHPNLTVILLLGADYDQARNYLLKIQDEYQNIDAKKMNEIRNIFRFQATQIPYLEAFEEISGEIDYIFQTISGGYGVIGAYNASINAIHQGWIPKTPKLYGVQPDYANPFVRAWQSKALIYRDEFSVTTRMGLAYAVQRGDASDCYEEVSEIVRKCSGGSIDVCEQEIIQAKQLLLNKEGIDIGYTAAAALAGIRKVQDQEPILHNKILLFMATGLDRNSNNQPTPNFIHSL